MRMFFIYCVLVLSLSSVAQTEVISNISKAITENSEEKLRQYFDNSVEVNTPDNQGVYSQNQAVQVLKSFFAKYRCSTFEVSHTGNSAGGSKFLVGSYVSGSDTFRVSIFLKKVGEVYYIQEFSFEE